MTIDTTLHLVRYQDEARVDRDGSTHTVRLAIFWLGKFGPFTERFNRDGFSEQQLVDRVRTIRQQLEALHA